MHENSVVTTDTAAFVLPLVAPKVLSYGEVTDRSFARGPASIEDRQPMSEGARVQTHEATSRSRAEDRMRVALALAPQGWEPVQTSRAPKATTISDTFRTNAWRPPSQPAVPTSSAWDHWRAWAHEADLRLALNAVASLLLGATLVLVLVLAYLGDIR